MVTVNVSSLPEARSENLPSLSAAVADEDDPAPSMFSRATTLTSMLSSSDSPVTTGATEVRSVLYPGNNSRSARVRIAVVDAEASRLEIA